MKLLDQLKNRYNILTIAIVLMIFILLFELATLTIARGEELRKKSDEKRVRELSITAPRGEIRDRYGRLLAGNKPSFTVQLLKDELTSRNINRNNILLNLVNILEEEGENYTDEMPIKFNTFVYNEDYKFLENDQTPQDRVIDILIERELIGELLESRYIYTKEGHNYNFLVGQRAKNVLSKSGVDVPINVVLNDNGNTEFLFDKNTNIVNWLSENNIEIGANPKDALVNLVSNDKQIMKKMFTSSIVRRLGFEALQKHGLTTEVYMSDYSLTYDNEYWDIKDRLIEAYADITETTSAKEDFITIAKKEAAEELLDSVIVKTDKDVNTFIVPAEILIELLGDNDIHVPIEVFLSQDENELILNYASIDSMKTFLENEKFDKEDIDNILSFENKKNACIKVLLLLGEKYSLLDDIIIHNDIKRYVQGLILEKNINPRISVSKNFQYVSYKEKIDWMEEYGIDFGSNAKEAFNLLRKKYNIDEQLSIYEARGILVMIEQLNEQGYKGYQPINVAQGIENKTVARIEENNIELQGIQISVEPSRYYPHGYLAAHTLGYMGKISQPGEIQRYLTERDDYSLNDSIGKTGIEQRFEEYLNGDDGTKRVEVDAYGNTVTVLEETKAVPGDNVYLTIDAHLQKVAEESLKHALEQIQVNGEFQSKWGNYNYKEDNDLSYATSGAVVAIDVKTGEILAIASYPAYDPNLFVPYISTYDWESLQPENEEDLLAPRPLYNVSIQTAVQPGSIYKMITALAALEKGLDPEYKIYDKGYIDLGGAQPACWLWNSQRRTHKYENVYEAIRDSCNYYFFSLMIGTSDRYKTESPIKLELSDLIELSKRFGLNERTGIEITGESSGNVPSEESQGKIANSTLRNFLINNRNAVKEDGDLTDEEIEFIISHAYAWANDGKNYTKGRINRKLDELELGLQIHTPLKFTETTQLSLSDYITFTYLKDAKFQIGNWLNISIGQGENSYTPIQMASYIATLANDGYKSKVSVIDRIKSYDDKHEVLKYDRVMEDIGLIQDNLEAVQKGMLKVTERWGTAYSTFGNFPVKVAGKTGTAEKDGVIPGTDGREYDNYSWFVAYAPYDNPQIAVTTLLVQGGSGGYGAPVAREIIAEYLGLNSQNQNISFDNKLVR